MGNSSSDHVRARDRRIAAAIERWFATTQRDLPWRRSRSGYATLVSEAMLQQTQVSRVVEMFEAFMRRFPSVARLAAAPEREVLAAWQGLGYYTRARRLHAAAKAIVERFGGEVPSDVEVLRSLPGIGRYTAGAIASIAFAARAPIVDANVARVVMRLDARAGAANGSKNVEWCWSRAEALVEASSDPAVFNEGLMELGAMTCKPREPRCAACPLAKSCHARAAGSQTDIPVPSKATARRRVFHHAVVVVRDDRILLEQRDASGLWASMWQVPTVERDAALEIESLSKALPRSFSNVDRVREFTHMTSHREVIFVVHRARSRTRVGTWVARDEIDAYPLSNPMRKIVAEALGAS